MQTYISGILILRPSIKTLEPSIAPFTVVPLTFTKSFALNSFSEGLPGQAVKVRPIIAKKIIILLSFFICTTTYAF